MIPFFWILLVALLGLNSGAAASCITGDFSPHPADCTKYYVCNHGQQIQLSCPNGLHWNALHRFCDWPQRSRCFLESGQGQGESGRGVTTDEPDSSFQFVDNGYGKNTIKLLHVRREGDVHYIKELTVNTELTLNTTKDYLSGDNSDIVATDSQKNTVYILAKLHGVKSPEAFGLLITNHLLTEYPRVIRAKVHVDDHPWSRMISNGTLHKHAFIEMESTTRFSTIVALRGALPEISSGLKDMKVLKTLQSGFTNFVRDEFTTLPDINERILSTVVYAKWSYAPTEGERVDFDKSWHTVQTCILDAFAGPPNIGVFSPSVQNTLYQAQKKALEKIPQILKIEIEMPNKHYIPFDFSKFSRLNGTENNDVFVPYDAPSGNIRAILGRKTLLNQKA